MINTKHPLLSGPWASSLSAVSSSAGSGRRSFIKSRATTDWARSEPPPIDPGCSDPLRLGSDRIAFRAELWCTRSLNCGANLLLEFRRPAIGVTTDPLSRSRSPERVRRIVRRQSGLLRRRSQTVRKGTASSRSPKRGLPTTAASREPAESIS